MQRLLAKSFNAVTATPLSGLRYKERWLDFGRSMADGGTVRTAAARCGIAVSTAFRWRHRWLAAHKSGAGKLAGIVEADETFLLSSRKGERNLGRKPRKRGGKAGKRGLPQRADAGLGCRGPRWRDRHRGLAIRLGGQPASSPRTGAEQGRPAGSPRWRQLSASATAALGVSHEARGPKRRRACPWRSAYPDGQQPHE